MFILAMVLSCITLMSSMLIGQGVSLAKCSTANLNTLRTLVADVTFTVHLGWLPGQCGD